MTVTNGPSGSGAEGGASAFPARTWTGGADRVDAGRATTDTAAAGTVGADVFGVAAWAGATAGVTVPGAGARSFCFFALRLSRLACLRASADSSAIRAA